MKLPSEYDREMLRCWQGDEHHPMICAGCGCCADCGEPVEVESVPFGSFEAGDV